ncbi:hypothetical protein ACLOJK_002405 [Asimina triloba]
MEENNSEHPERQLYRRMRLWEFPDQYIIEPTDGNSDSYLAVSCVDGSLELIGSYMVVITERECVGSYLGHPIFRKKLETEFFMLLNAAERTSGLYFSYDVNLTLSAQRLHDLGDESKVLPLWRQADQRFVWNNYMLEVLIEKKKPGNPLSNLLSCWADFELVAFQGTRCWRRGADPDGYVANFVETEQIMQAKGITASFVQCRLGIVFSKHLLPYSVHVVSITLHGRLIAVNVFMLQPKVAERHFLDLSKRYRSVLAVDLVNKHGVEGRLCEKYVHFDFHRICGHSHFDRLSILYDQIADILKKNGTPLVVVVIIIVVIAVVVVVVVIIVVIAVVVVVVGGGGVIVILCSPSPKHVSSCRHYCFTSLPFLKSSGCSLPEQMRRHHLE